MILEYYFHDDYSLAEIAEVLNISRQAVFEHIKRAEGTLEELESKLGLASKYEQRRDILKSLQKEAETADEPLRGNLINRLQCLADLE